ncbi:MAG: aminopeptidase P family protein [Sphaerochaetaceae bacterium]|nr:aminopeptidase P family protein [Sphaerochaetaceae bacterium]
MTVNEKVEKLREVLRENNLKAWIINGTDPHESEYVCPRWQSRKFISGFSGSAGTVIVTLEKALIWVDSRYFVQCADQIKGTVFEMRKTNGPEATSPVDYLKNTFTKEDRVGIAAETLMVKEKRNYEKNGISICAMDDLLNRIWTDRPDMPSTPVDKMSVKYSGETTKSKIERMRKKAAEDKADYMLISSLDDIAWILNMRADDVEDTPVFLSHLLIGKDTVELFTPPERFSSYDISKEAFELFPYEETASHLSKLKDVTLRLNPARINMELFNALDPSVKIQEGLEYSTDFKACKNRTEIAGMRKAHILDGVALVNFLSDVERNKSKDGYYTELSISKALEDERKKMKEYLGPSFSTIAGFADHGAVVHYSATEETDRKITGNGLLVLDSGGQYMFGTTDITRTLLFGKATKQQKEDYTMVLKGHLALAAQVFPDNTDGHQLDILAHMFLWNRGLNFFHGTGHGVGHRLAVHEGPQRISSAPSSAGIFLKEGMVVSDEPGLYREGSHGIRIENLISVTKYKKTEFGQFLTFEELTCCPYERRLILKEMLTDEEIHLIDCYHEWVYNSLISLVDKRARAYLKKATRPL